MASSEQLLVQQGGPGDLVKPRRHGPIKGMAAFSATHYSKRSSLKSANQDESGLHRRSCPVAGSSDRKSRGES